MFGGWIDRKENFMTDTAAVTAITSLNLSRYLGKWYELCRLPIKYEDETATDITANYSLNDSVTVRVDNRCFDKHGKPFRAIGEATPVDDARSRLKVTFLPKYIRWIPFTSGDYWVLKLDPEYKVSLVGSPDRQYLWLLARSPDLAQDTRERYLAEAKRQGFDLTNLIVPRHTGREVSNDMLAG
ncbi:outer membrane lipoprotein [Mesorhizobium japonicum MAFF 303099]|uniref:Outer membrane lipoprotein Blc n=2 Tax=Mesorhizobium japonicum TaxID=2066070 RepID=Q98DG2_RHILO|nr:outer membrane lipoprotein [Mesorhizobium japonicum MAFF 303099]